MNRVILSSRFSDKYAQAFYLIYSSSSGILRYSNAAYNPVILFDTDKMMFQELDTDGIPIGIDRDFSYKSQIIRVMPNSLGILYSNGITNAINNAGDNYTTERIKGILKKNKNDTPAILIRKIYADFKDFVTDTELPNDASLIIFRIG